MIGWLTGRLGVLGAPLIAKGVLILGAIVLTLGTALWVQTWRLGEAQESISLAKAQAEAAIASAKATVDVLNAERATKDAEIQAAITEASKDRPTQTRIVERIARADPTFAACRRPDELHAIRVRQLADVDKANAD